MQRRKIPIVPAPTGTPMPEQENDGNKKAQLYSIYLRPWVLDKTLATKEVPHIADLDLSTESGCPGNIIRHRLRGKQSPHKLMQPRRSFSEAWRNYIRGNVVSRHAQRIIVQFMAAHCETTSRNENPEEDVNGTNSCPTNVPNNVLPLARVHHILDHMASPTETTPAQPKAGEENGSDGEDMQEMPRSEQVTNALKVTARLWSRLTTSWSETAVDITTSSLSSNPSMTRSTKRTAQKNKQLHPRAFQNRAYISWKESCVQDWSRQLKKLPEPPTAEHMAFLQRVVQRCRREQESLKDSRT